MLAWIHYITQYSSFKHIFVGTNIRVICILIQYTL